nr:hypothetical protein GCM10020092_068640 [Actinoplanes digitatis]
MTTPDAFVGHQVHVDAARAGGGGDADAGGEELGEPPAAGRAEHDLGGVGAARELQQRRRDVPAHDLVVGAAEALDQDPLSGQRRRVGTGQAVVARYMHGQQVGTLGAVGDPGGPADQGVALRAAGERDDDAFPGLPGGVDPVGGAVGVELVVDLVGEPEQGQLAQGGEVAGAEVVAERGVDLLRPVDVAVRHPPAQRLRGHVDQLDLLGGADHRVGHGLALLDAGDLRDHVVERLQVLHVDRRQNGGTGVEQFLHVLPALGVAAARHVGVGQFVHHGHRGGPVQERVQVHLGEIGPTVGHPTAGDHLQVADHRGGVRAAVRLDQPDDDVGAALGAAVRLLQHGVRLADARCGTKVDA